MERWNELTCNRQFGNMLVLAATWHDGRLRELVNTCRFLDRLDRTIAFLGDLAAISPTCRADRDILVKLRRLLFSRASIEDRLDCSDDDSSVGLEQDVRY